MSATRDDECLMYLIRHGATENNLASPPLLQGYGIDLGLTETGRQQAQATETLLAKTPLQAIYASPLKRAIETAQTIGRSHQLDVQIVRELIEVDVGSWEGRSWDEISRTDSERHANFLSDPATHGYRDGENLSQVVERAMPAIERLARENLGRQVAIVSHNVVNRVVIAHLLNIPLAHGRSIYQDNCGVNVIRYRAGKYKVMSVNSSFHVT